MPSIKQTLQAGVSHKLPCNGYFFQLIASNADVTISFYEQNNANSEIHENIKTGFFFDSPVLLSYAEITSSISQEIEYIYSRGKVGIDRTITQTRFSQGSVINDSLETVNNTRDIVLLADDNRTRVIFTADDTNTGTIYLGGSSVTTANSAIILNAGDSFVDDKAAIAEYSAIASSNGQKLRISEA